MSKLIDNLNHVQATMSDRPDTTVIPSTNLATPTVNRKEQSKLPINNETFYIILASVAVVVVLAFALSLKALASIRAKSDSEFAKLSDVIIKQSEKIRSLEDSIVKLSSQQGQQQADLKSSLAMVEKLMNTSTKELAELTITNNSLSLAVKDLKSENKALKNDYNDLTNEINRVKQMLARMTGEVPAPAQ